jgi:cytochrome c-type biogenesis protein CcmH/NrfG
MDIVTILIFAGMLAFQVGGYLLFKSYQAAAERVQRQRDFAQTRPHGGLGSFVGGRDRLGED